MPCACNRDRQSDFAVPGPTETLVFFDEDPKKARSGPRRTLGFLFSFCATLPVVLLFVSARVAQADTNIVWSDEFDGTALDTNHWTYDIGNGFWVSDPGFWIPGWGNNELEYYTSRTQNVHVAGGLLHIAARRENYGGFSYTSGRIKSAGLFARKYGRIDFRVKLPEGIGFWPALWMMPQNSPYGGWPNSGEIDVMENNGSRTNQVGGTIHYGGAQGHEVHSGQTFTFTGTTSTTDFHVYGLDWTTNALRWYVDGQLYQTQTSWWSNVGTSSDTYPYPAPFDQPFYLLMNLAVGGNYVGNPDTNQINASLPGEMLVDYVRLYDQTAPLRLSMVWTNGNLELNWPTSIVCHLQAQTNTAGVPEGTDWADVAGATAPFLVRPDPQNQSIFYRLQSP